METYRDYWNVPHQIPPNQYSSQPQGEVVREARENLSNTCFISQLQTGGQFLNKVALNGSKTSCNTSFQVFKDEVSRSPLTHYTRKCSTSPFAQYMMKDKRGSVRESLLENNSYLFLNDNQRETSHPEESRRHVKDASVNSEPTCCKPLSSASPPEPALTSSLMTKFWIPPPVESAKQEGGCDKGEMSIGTVWEQNANDVVSNHLSSTKLLDVKSQGNVKDSFVEDWTTTYWNTPSVTEDTSSETPFALFSECPVTRNKLEAMDEFEH